MKFVISYSCGKDSALALYRMIKQGHVPIAMITTINSQQERSWFHGIDDALLNRISQSLNIPLIACVTDGENYHISLEESLRKAKTMGAEGCVFGDIDITGHLDWNRLRCENAGLECIVPLWQESREAIVKEIIDNKFIAIIKCVQNKYKDSDILGKVLTYDLARQIEQSGADVCGENGEYHTVVVDAPIFRFPIDVTINQKLDLGSVSVADIVCAGAEPHEFFSNYACKYYNSCHGGEIKNCLFCYCPLYNYNCPGAYSINEKNIKDCSNCIYPHKPNSYKDIISFLEKK